VSEDQLIRVDTPLLALQDLAACYRSVLPSTTIVAIAGSCGKTMLKDLMGHLFSSSGNSLPVYISPESFNSQLGVALSVLHIPSTASLAFIEMAATKAGEMDRLVSMVRPDYAAVTNFFQKRFCSPENREKVFGEIIALLSSLPPTGWAIAEQSPRFHPEELPCPCYFWNEETDGLPNIRPLSPRGGEQRSMICRFPDGSEETMTINGPHAYLIDLVSLAIKTAWKLGLRKETIVHALQTYEPQIMRTEIWKNSSGTTFINGTYCHTALSFDASIADMKGYIHTSEGKKILLFGGIELQRNSPRSDTSDEAIVSHMNSTSGISSKRLVESMIHHGISEVYAWPQTMAHVLEEAAHGTIPIHAFSTCDSALRSVKSALTPSDTVIFKGARKLPVEWLIDQLEESPPKNIACINLAAIRSNIDQIRAKLSPNTRIMVMVKALGYGTDDIRIACFLRTCGVDILGVSYVDEGVGLRRMGVEQDIFSIHAAENEMKKAVHWNIEVGVSSASQIEAAGHAAQIHGGSIRVHLHVDTGMKRFGCTPEEAVELGRLIHRSPHLIFQGIFTHFAAADDPVHDDFTLCQARTLARVCAALQQEGISPHYRHACNSAAAIRFGFERLPKPPLAQGQLADSDTTLGFNMVRIGLATYGFHTSMASSSLIELRPALSLITRIAGLNEARTGDTVSYGRTHCISHPNARLAVLPIGYYDGLHRNYSGKGSVLIRDQKAPMVGRICMDYMIVDVTHIPEASIGDQVVLFGESEGGAYLPPEELAHAGGSIVHELMACLGPRIQRLFIYDESLLTR
jgi:alanine racemase/UDP-N-acetylmuramoyl-tripeptide--D-alanyl-D-alanine ligase